jgi:hypothetical protein
MAQEFLTLLLVSRDRRRRFPFPSTGYSLGEYKAKIKLFSKFGEFGIFGGGLRKLPAAASDTGR